MVAEVRYDYLIHERIGWTEAAALVDALSRISASYIWYLHRIEVRTHANAKGGFIRPAPRIGFLARDMKAAPGSRNSFFSQF